MNKISVIIPSFNGGRFIAATLKSILKQKGDFNIEIIIIDNNSIDNTIAVIKDIKSNYIYKYNITIDINQNADKGIMDAWNKGFKKSTGDYVAFCNVSDYYYHEDWFNNCIETMEIKSWVFAVYGLTLKLNEVGYKFHGIGGQRILSVLKDNQMPEQCLTAFINHGITWNECTAVLRREAVESLYPFTVNDFGSTLAAMRKFYENGYLSYFLDQLGAVTLIHYDSGTNNHQSSQKADEMWKKHYKQLTNYKSKLIKNGVFYYRNSKNNISNIIQVRG